MRTILGLIFDVKWISCHFLTEQKMTSLITRALCPRNKMGMFCEGSHTNPSQISHISHMNPSHVWHNERAFCEHSRAWKRKLFPKEFRKQKEIPERKEKEFYFS